MSDQGLTGPPVPTVPAELAEGRRPVDHAQPPQSADESPVADAQPDPPATGDPTLDEAVTSLDRVHPDDLDGLIDAGGKVLSALQTRLGDLGP